MKIRQHQRNSARTVDSILEELHKHRSTKQVARSCATTPRTVTSWRLRRGQLAIPNAPARTKLVALVEEQLGDGSRASLESAWNSLTTDTTAHAALLSGDEAAEERVGLNADSGQLTRDQRLLVVRQARLVLEQAYAHLSFKRARHAVDPVQRLRLLEYRLAAGEGEPEPEVSFHREMIDIFTLARDLHTTYVAPVKYQEAVLTLPFIVEEFFEHVPGGGRQAMYVASKVDDGHDAHNEFRNGVRVTHWNAVPIDRAIQVLANKQAAGNAPAASARALDALTQRPLLSTMVPDAEWIDVTFEPEAGRTETARFRWTREKFPQSLLDDLHLKVPLGIDAQTDAVSELRKLKYGRNNQQWTSGDEQAGALDEAIALADFHLETHMPWFFKAHPTSDGQFGYMRLFKFKTRNAAAFADEFGRLVSELPQDGLIIDVRGNPGGNIQAAECTLQVLSSTPISPLRAQFTTSPLLLSICRNNATASRRSASLGPWIKSLAQAVSTGSAFSRGYPLTPTALLQRVTHRYPGPVVLIVDAHCYSATDMFAAGFIDHGLGKVLGVSDNTGAGGANVWRHSDLVRLATGLPPDDAPLQKLPAGIDFRVAVRRTTRVNDHEGEILEDLGIEIDERHYMTRRDVFEGNRDLVAAATRLLG